MSKEAESYGTHTRVEACVLPGGRLPARQTDGALGYDLYARAVLSPQDLDEANPLLRKTLFDFHNVPDSASIQERVIADPVDTTKWAYLLPPGERVLLGVGFTTALPPDLLYLLVPRSGLGVKGIHVLAGPGIIDPDYRGEAGVLLANESSDDFVLRHHMRVAQALFLTTRFVRFIVHPDHHLMPETQRGGRGMGSTGLVDEVPVQPCV